MSSKSSWYAVAALLWTTASCGSAPKETPAADVARAAAPASTVTLRGTTGRSDAVAQPAVQLIRPAIDYEALKVALPELDGWRRAETKGEQLTTPIAYSRAQARYQRDSSHIDLEISDTGMSPQLLAPVSMFLTAGFSERSDDGYKRAVKVSGQPGLEAWNGRSQEGEVTAVIRDRFIVHAVGHEMSNIDPVRTLVAAVDLSKLPSVK